MTGSREQLTEEYLEWATKFEDAKNRLNSLLPSRIGKNAQDRAQPFVLTEQMLIEYSIISEEMDEAWAHMRAMCDKITKL